MGKFISSLSSNREKYLFIANGVDYRKSFIVVDPYFFGEMLTKAGLNSMRATVDLMLQETKEMVSMKYRDIRSKR